MYYSTSSYVTHYTCFLTAKLRPRHDCSLVAHIAISAPSMDIWAGLILQICKQFMMPLRQTNQFLAQKFNLLSTTGPLTYFLID